MKNLVILTSLFGACTVGEIQQGNPSQPDAGGGDDDPMDAPIGGGDDAPAALACVPRGTPGTPHAHAGGGGSRAAQSCVVGGCHLNGQTGAGASAFQFAGVLYLQGTATPDPGGVIVIIPDDTTKPQIKMVADTDGVFHSGPPVSGSMPASAAATACNTSQTPTMGHLVGKLNGQSTPGKGGDCTGCHGNTQPSIYIAP